MDSDKSKKIELIFDTYKHLMFHVINQIIQDEILSEDAVQDAMIRIINNLDKINEINCHKTKSFIVIISRRIAIDYYRKRKKTKIIFFDSLEKEIESRINYFDDSNNDVLEAIQSLSYIYREVLLLKYVNEFSNKEISESLNISENLIRKRLERGKNQLKKKLKEDGIL